MKIEHIAVYVQDLEKMKEFYCKYFHALAGPLYHNRITDFRSCFLAFPDGARLEIMHRPNLCIGKENTFGYAHIAFSLGSREKVDEMTELLKTDGFRLISGPRTTGDGYYESCIEDPEGNFIELTE